MARKTQDSDSRSERRKQVDAHVAWLMLQKPAIAALVQYARGCALYVPIPTEEWKPGFTYYRLPRMVLVPGICDKEVTIPAGHRQLAVMTDHGRPFCATISDPDQEGVVNRYMIDVVEGQEILLPGGRVATLKRSGGHWYVNEPDA